MSNMIYQQDFWKPEPDAYETSTEGWLIYQKECAEDMQLLKDCYPELESWGDLERMNAWSEFSSDVDFNAWSDPRRTDEFLVYLRLAQEGKLPDCSDDREAIYKVIQEVV